MSKTKKPQKSKSRFGVWKIPKNARVVTFSSVAYPLTDVPRPVVDDPPVFVPHETEA